MTNTTSDYDPDGVGYILELVDQLKEIAYAYQYAPNGAAKTSALREWRRATAGIGLDSVPRETRHRVGCRRAGNAA